MIISKKSNITGRLHFRNINITPSQFLRIEKGEELIQDICPELSASDREFLISGITPIEWYEAIVKNSLEDDDERLEYWKEELNAIELGPTDYSCPTCNKDLDFDNDINGSFVDKTAAELVNTHDVPTYKWKELHMCTVCETIYIIENGS